MVLKSVGNRAGVRAGVNLKAVRNCVVVEEVVQLDGIKAQTVLVAHVHRDSAVLLQVPDVLIDEGKRRIRCELGDDLRLRNTILCWQVEIQRRVLRIRRPRRCGRVGNGAEPRRLGGQIRGRLGAVHFSLGGERTFLGLFARAWSASPPSATNSKDS